MNFEPEAANNFIEEIVARDLESGKYKRIVTRFPPEPNGYLHIGHAKAFLLDFGIAEKYHGQCNLRFDDTNPVKEDTEYVDNIMQDIRFLGCDWGEGLHYASDYFEQLYAYAEEIIQKGLAYVDFQTAEQMRQSRGTLTQPGQNSPYRDTPPEENLRLFRAMKAGAYQEGECCLRAKIDMASPNMNLRDPAMYRIMYTTGRARPGASTRCMISPIPCPTPSRALRTASARWNLRITARCTIGFCRPSALKTRRTSTSLPA